MRRGSAILAVVATWLCLLKLGQGRNAPARLCNVLDYGAKGDGRALDTPAIVAAVSACSPGGTVLLPKARVYLSAPFNLTCNLTVDGEW